MATSIFMAFNYQAKDHDRTIYHIVQSSTVGVKTTWWPWVTAGSQTKTGLGRTRP